MTRFVTVFSALESRRTMRASLRRIALVAASLALFSACSSEPTSAPHARIAAPAAAPSASLLGSLLNTIVPGLERTSPLTSDITVSKTIGSGGGTLSIPAAGVTVTIPAGALSSSTVITMTARKGSLIAYDFAPHGITFAKPLVFTQNLSGTTATLLTAPLLKLAYYSDPNLLTALGGTASELISGTVNLLSWTFTSSINHFSGYFISCGLSGDATE